MGRRPLPPAIAHTAGLSACRRVGGYCCPAPASLYVWKEGREERGRGIQEPLGKRQRVGSRLFFQAVPRCGQSLGGTNTAARGLPLCWAAWHVGTLSTIAHGVMFLIRRCLALIVYRAFQQPPNTMP